MKCSVDEQNREVIDLWNIFIMVSKGKILVMKEIDRFRGGIDLWRGSIWEVLLYIYLSMLIAPGVSRKYSNTQLN